MLIRVPSIYQIKHCYKTLFPMCFHSPGIGPKIMVNVWHFKVYSFVLVKLQTT